jgi:hypothetical protein
MRIVNADCCLVYVNRDPIFVVDCAREFRPWLWESQVHYLGFQHEHEGVARMVLGLAGPSICLFGGAIHLSVRIVNAYLSRGHLSRGHPSVDENCKRRLLLGLCQSGSGFCGGLCA